MHSLVHTPLSLNAVNTRNTHDPVENRNFETEWYFLSISQLAFVDHEKGAAAIRQLGDNDQALPPSSPPANQ